MFAFQFEISCKFEDFLLINMKSSRKIEVINWTLDRNTIQKRKRKEKEAKYTIGP